MTSLEEEIRFPQLQEKKFITGSFDKYSISEVISLENIELTVLVDHAHLFLFP